MIKKLIRAALTILFLLYLAYLIYLTFFSHLYGRGYIHRSVNIIPFKTIIEYLGARINTNIILTNLLGNIAAFIPMGFLLPIVFRGLKKIGKSVLVIAGATIMIEVSQYIAGVGAADIDDVLLNLIGGLTGFAIYHIVKIFVSKMQNWIDGNI